jgi:glutamyl-tRNA reductase
MNLVLVGLNHKTAPVAVRERVAFQEERLPEAFAVLREQWGFEEGLILSTCNRVEVLGGSGANGTSPERLREFLCAFHRLDPAELKSHLYLLTGQELIQHVFRVASSLDSMVPGEAQILGQLKQAYAAAQHAGAVGRGLSRLLPHAFFVAKRVRTETRIGQSSVSVSSVAVDLAVKIFGELQGHSVLLLGAGKMGELAAEALLAAGADRVQVANRTPEKAEAIARRFQGEALSMERLEDALVASDIVVLSTGAPHFLITRKLADRVIRRRKYTPLFLVDISVPRNVDPVVNEIDNVFLYDIDDLQSVVVSNLEERRQEAVHAEEIVQDEVRSFIMGFHRGSIGPLMNAVRRRLEEICLEELTKDREAFSPQELARLERLMLRTAHRIAHPLMVEMKRTLENPSQRRDAAEAIAQAFHLEDPK